MVLNNEMRNKLNASLRGFAYTNVPVKLKENVDKLVINNTTITRLEKYAIVIFIFFVIWA